MRPSRQIAILVVFVLVLFFLVPAFDWGTISYVNTETLAQQGSVTEYRSLSCIAVGFGVTYFDGTYWPEGIGNGTSTNGFQLSCQGPFPS